MSIDDASKIDIVATRPESDEVKLVIADHLTWSDPDAHCRMIQDKVNTYIAFVESRQLWEVKGHRIPERPHIFITLAAKHAPAEVAWEFLSQLRAALNNIGIEFEVNVEAADA